MSRFVPMSLNMGLCFAEPSWIGWLGLFQQRLCQCWRARDPTTDARGQKTQKHLCFWQTEFSVCTWRSHRSTKLKLKNTSPPKSNEEISSKSDEPVEKKGLQLLKNPTLSKISYDWLNWVYAYKDIIQTNAIPALHMYMHKFMCSYMYIYIYIYIYTYV